MSHRKKNRHLNELPVYTGQFDIKTHIECITYSSESFSEKKEESVQGVLGNIKDGSVAWVRVYGMTDTQLIIDLVKGVGLDILDAKDILTTQHIMSVEEYEKNVFIVLPVSYSIDGEKYSEQVALIMGKNYLVTIKESDHQLFNGIYSGIKNNKNQKFSNRNSSFLMASILNEVVNLYGDEIIRLEDELEDLEDQLLDINRVHKDMINIIQKRRRELISLRKKLFPFKDQISKLLRVESGLIEEKDIPYFKDIYDQMLYNLQNI